MTNHREPRQHTSGARRRPASVLAGIGMIAALILAACSDAAAPAAPATKPAVVGKPDGSAPDSGAPDSTTPSRRVDLAEPTFSNPTAITNPLFPKSKIPQTVALGAEGPEQLRFEATQLPQTRVIEWKGKKIETRVTHFVAYGDGRLIEIAFDHYAQADDGAVWYFGEDVDNYKDGAIENHNGTWLAGKDGNPGMIMPGSLKVGDMFRPEDIPKVVYEEATVLAVNLTVPGPRGQVNGAARVSLKLLDGTVEEKLYAPDYGEYQGAVKSLNELYDIAIAVSVDATPGAVPAELASIVTKAVSIIDAAKAADWNTASAASTEIEAAWTGYAKGGPWPRLTAQMTTELAKLKTAITAKSASDARQAAIHAATASLDFQLRYRTPAEVDLSRLVLWTHQVVLDADALGAGKLLGDAVVLNAIWKRAGHTVTSATKRTTIETNLKDLLAAASAKDFATSATLAATLRTNLVGP